MMKASLDEIIEAALNALIEAITKAESEVSGRLLEFLAKLETQKGALTRAAFNDRLLTDLSDHLEKVLEDVGVSDHVTKYLRAFNETSSYLTAQQLAMN